MGLGSNIASALGWTSNEEPAEAARKTLGLEGLKGSNLLQAAIRQYREGHCVEVYQLYLNVQIDDRNFYEYQGLVMRHSHDHEYRGRDQAEVTVRTLIEIGHWKPGRLAQELARQNRR